MVGRILPCFFVGSVMGPQIVSTCWHNVKNLEKVRKILKKLENLEKIEKKTLKNGKNLEKIGENLEKIGIVLTERIMENKAG